MHLTILPHCGIMTFPQRAYGLVSWGLKSERVFGGKVVKFFHPPRRKGECVTFAFLLQLLADLMGDDLSM